MSTYSISAAIMFAVVFGLSVPASATKPLDRNANAVSTVVAGQGDNTLLDAGQPLFTDFDVAATQRRNNAERAFQRLDFGTGADIAFYGQNADGTDMIVPAELLAEGTGAVPHEFASVGSDKIGPVIENIIATMTAVPEPGTWSLMIAGFGLAGVLLRRRSAEMVSFS